MGSALAFPVSRTQPPQSEGLSGFPILAAVGVAGSALALFWNQLTGSELDDVVDTVGYQVVTEHLSYFPCSGLILSWRWCLDSDVVRQVIVSYMNLALRGMIPEYEPGLASNVIGAPVSYVTATDHTLVVWILQALYDATWDKRIASTKFLRPRSYAEHGASLEHLDAPYQDAECDLFCEIGGWIKWLAILGVVGVGAWAFFQATEMGANVRRAFTN